ncbi:CAP domain-containing protein [Candidatus Micrarchaeota archaeon]|nr:CAP domain-containing protein [Candidatus Micrarchaeota archaeon]
MRLLILFLILFSFGCTSNLEDSDIGTPPDLEKIRILIFQYTNEERVNYGLGPLIYDPNLEKMANWQSKCLAENDIFEHDSIECGTLEQRFQYFQINDSGGENLFLNWDAEYYYDDNWDPVEYSSEEEIAHSTVDGWMLSPGHRANVLDEFYTHMAIGIYLGDEHDILITQNFKIAENCGWKNEPCCPEENDYFSCYDPWVCDFDVMRCR